MSDSFRLLKLEQDVMQIKKQLIHKDEEKHRTWCDTQERLLGELKSTHEQVAQLDIVITDDHDRLIRVEQMVNEDHEKLISLESSTTSSHELLQTIVQNTSQLPDQMSGILSDFEILKLEFTSRFERIESDISEIKDTLKILSVKSKEN